MPKCLGCGRSYKTYYGDTRRFVKSCSACMKLFPDKDFNKIINDFFR